MWWLDHDVLAAVQWIDNTITVKDSSVYDPERALDREQEAALFAHYGKDGYWAN